MIHKIRLTDRDIEHILYQFEVTEREGLYYGNKDYYSKRDERLKGQFNDLLKKKSPDT